MATEAQLRAIKKWSTGITGAPFFAFLRNMVFL